MTVTEPETSPARERLQWLATYVERFLPAAIITALLAQGAESGWISPGVLGAAGTLCLYLLAGFAAIGATHFGGVIGERYGHRERGEWIGTAAGLTVAMVAMMGVL